MIAIGNRFYYTSADLEELLRGQKDDILEVVEDRMGELDRYGEKTTCTVMELSLLLDTIRLHQTEEK